MCLNYNNCVSPFYLHELVFIRFLCRWSLKVTSAIKHGNTAEEIIIYAHRVYSLLLKFEKNKA